MRCCTACVKANWRALQRAGARWWRACVHGGGIARGQVFVPIHWNGANASDARVGAVVNPVVDPVSGEPEFKHTPVRIEQFRVHWYAFVLSRTPLTLDGVAHWTRVQGEQFLRYELAGPQSDRRPGRLGARPAGRDGP